MESLTQSGAHISARRKRNRENQDACAKLFRKAAGGWTCRRVVGSASERDNEGDRALYDLVKQHGRRRRIRQGGRGRNS